MIDTVDTLDQPAFRWAVSEEQLEQDRQLYIDHREDKAFRYFFGITRLFFDVPDPMDA